MPRAKTKSVSRDGILHAAAPGCIETRACKDGNDQRQYHVKGIEKQDAISLELAHCTAFMGRNEALQFSISVVHAGSKQWGDEFVADVQRLIEGL